jgi:hypothetical protein
LQVTKHYRALRNAVLSCVIIAVLAWHPVHATENIKREYLTGGSLRLNERYFVDFHARRGPSITGHTFIAYGRLDARGKILEAKAVGFFPDTDRYWISLLIPVRGVFGEEKSDYKVLSSVIYRRYLTAAEFYQLNAKVSEARATHAPWNLIFNNCNDFVGEIAKSIGLHRPPSLLLPTTYVSLLHALNGV